MIYVGTALKKEEIKKTLEDLGYTFAGLKGIRMKFETGADDDETAIAKAKVAIKGTSYGKVLYFTVNANPIA